MKLIRLAYICDFCGKDEKQVLKMISGLAKMSAGKIVQPVICNECIDLSIEIIREDPSAVSRAMAELL